MNFLSSCILDSRVECFVYCFNGRSGRHYAGCLAWRMAVRLEGKRNGQRERERERERVRARATLRGDASASSTIQRFDANDSVILQLCDF